MGFGQPTCTSGVPSCLHQLGDGFCCFFHVFFRFFRPGQSSIFAWYPPLLEPVKALEVCVPLLSLRAFKQAMPRGRPSAPGTEGSTNTFVEGEMTGPKHGTHPNHLLRGYRYNGSPSDLPCPVCGGGEELNQCTHPSRPQVPPCPTVSRTCDNVRLGEPHVRKTCGSGPWMMEKELVLMDNVYWPLLSRKVRALTCL